MRSLVDTDDLTIAVSEGNTGRAVVAFTGVGLRLGGIQTPEFQFSLSAASMINTVYHVIDKQRSWYERVFESIVAVLTGELAGFDSVATLGNSMGGFGAVLFAGLLPRCRSAMAFVPQFSLAPHIVGDNDDRWTEYTSRIDRWTVDH